MVISLLVVAKTSNLFLHAITLTINDAWKCVFFPRKERIMKCRTTTGIVNNGPAE